MSGITEDIRTFDRELTVAFTLLSDSFFEVHQAAVVHDTFVTILKQFVAAHQAIDDKYRELEDVLGKPVSPVKMAAKGGYYRVYERGAIYWHPKTGAHRVYGAIYQKYVHLGAEAGFLGYPITDEFGTPDNRGRYNHFEGGSIYWTNTTGANEVHGAIRDKWSLLGWEKSPLGYPIIDETPTPDKIGRYNHFEHGSIYWTEDTGACEVLGVIRDKWAALGWERSYLGYPITDEIDWDTGVAVIGRLSRFQRGAIGDTFNNPNVKEIPDSSFLATGPLNVSELPITGWLELIINSNGTFSYRGHLHNSGWVGYHVAVVAALNFQDSDGGVIMAAEEGHLSGTSEGGGSDRDHDWEWSGFEPRIRDNWDILRTRAMTVSLKAGATLGDVVAGILTTIPIAIAIGVATFVAWLFGSGELQACRGTGYIYRDPDNVEHRVQGYPICQRDPDIPNDNCCKRLGYDE
jgi:hypothetical protein